MPSSVIMKSAADNLPVPSAPLLHYRALCATAHYSNPRIIVHWGARHRRRPRSICNQSDGLAKDAIRITLITHQSRAPSPMRTLRRVPQGSTPNSSIDDNIPAVAQSHSFPLLPLLGLPCRFPVLTQKYVTQLLPHMVQKLKNR